MATSPTVVYGPPRGSAWWLIRLILLILAILCFAVAAFHGSFPSFDLIALGLALGFASFLPIY